MNESLQADFEHQVDELQTQAIELREQVIELRSTLARISSFRREDFGTGFRYELAVRQEADYALRRYPRD